MNEPLDELYLKWLYRQVGNVRLKNPARTYWVLLRQLYKKEFVWIIPNDDNRLEDGRDLRDRFVDEEGINSPDPHWMDLGCSMLEVLVALAQCLNFEDESRDVGEWFWELIHNLGLRNSTDANPRAESEINDILDGVIWRTYNRSGVGGLFPLHHAKKDQRNVELWYQLNAYLLENN